MRTRLRSDLDSDEGAVYASWFLGRPNDAGLPARCGYFVAHRWIREVGVPFRELVGLNYEQARAALDSVA